MKQLNLLLIAALTFSMSVTAGEHKHQEEAGHEAHEHHEGGEVAVSQTVDEHEMHDDLEERESKGGHEGLDDHEGHDDEEGHEGHEDDRHDDHGEEQAEHGGHEDHNEAALIEMNAKQQQLAGVVVSEVHVQNGVNKTLYAPGELVNNLYKTTMVVALSEARVLSRQVILGQEVSKGEPLVTLYSERMSSAQSALKISAQEWLRVKSLGLKVVGRKRYTTARVDYEHNRAEVLALGMSEKDTSLLTEGKWSKPLGQYVVAAPHAGTVIADDFQQGELLAAGGPLLTLVNEDELWVEARLAPQVGQKIPAGTQANVKVGDLTLAATVVQENHVIEENTRTRKVRLAINNKEHLLHAGMFVDVYLKLPINKSVILLPESALMRSSDGDWVVFVEEEAGKFEQKEIEIQGVINGKRSIQGLESGERVVTEGAFFVASELAKGGFDPHNH